MRTTVIPAGALSVALALIGVCSCASDPTTGYAFGSGRRNDIRTITVPIWENRTFTPGLEAQLTEAIIKELQQSTRWIVVDTGAATTLTGVLTNSNLRRLGEDPFTGLTQELAVDLAVDFKWRNNRTRRPLVERKNFHGDGVFIPTQGINEPIEVGQLGAIESLAKSIVAELRSEW